MIKKQNKPAVSVIMPAFNAQVTIPASIESVINQSIQNWELLIVDDCSDDCTRAICEFYAKKDSRIKLIINEKNYGVSYSRNLALEIAQGNYISFLDSDDLWVNFKLELQLKCCCDFVYSPYYHIDERDGFIKLINAPNKLCYKDLLFYNSIGLVTALVSKKLIGDTRFVNIGHEDYCFWLDILQKIPFAYSSGEQPLGSYRKLKDSLSSSKIKSLNWHWAILSRQKDLNYLQKLYYISNYIIHGIKKHYL